MAEAAARVRRAAERVLDIRWPLRGIGCAGAVAIVAGTFVYGQVAGVKLLDRIPAAVAEVAGWLCLLLLVMTGWDAARVLRHEDPLQLTEPEPARWRRWWIAPLVLAAGLLIGWKVFT